MKGQPVRFKSKVDVWLALVMYVCALGSLSAAYALVVQGAGAAALVGAALVLATGAVLPLWILWGTGYEVDAQDLRVRCGPMRWTIPLASITRMTPSRSILSAPALSLDRICLHHGRAGLLLVSPDNAEAFLRAIREGGGGAG